LRKLLFMKRFTLAILFFPLMSLAQDKLSESNYRIFSVARNKEVTLKEIVKDMRDRDVLLFGEEHNDSVSHYLEHTLLEMLHAKYNDVALSLEMFDRDVQPVMDEYLHGFIKEKHFLKDARVWSNYKDYKPMVEFAKENALDVICANAPSRYANLAGRKGQGMLTRLPDESKEFFAPLPYDTATGAYYAKLTGLPEHAGGTVNDTTKAKAAPMMSMGGFDLVEAQSLWDATMAYSISKYLKKHKGRKVMQVNGRFHSDEGFAVATQLAQYSPKAEQLIVSTGSDESFPNIKWDEYKKMGDFIIITDPKVPRSYKD
jgi:uncharacterized iron-regulated protein